MVIKLPPSNESYEGLKVNFVGTKEAVQWPAKQKALLKGEVKGNDIGDLKLLEDIHVWLEKKNRDSIDALLFGTVGGVVVV